MFLHLFTLDWVKHVLICNYSNDILQIMEFKIVLLKSTPMNHCHSNFILFQFNMFPFFCPN